MDIKQLLMDSGMDSEKAKKVSDELMEIAETEMRDKITEELKLEYGILDPKKKKTVRKIDSFEEWSKSEIYPTTFIRPDGTQVVIECRGLTHGEVEKIQKECTINPPKMPKRNPLNGKIMSDEKGVVLMENNYDDPEYIKDFEQMRKKEMTMTLELGLTQIKIPGKDWKEKWENLNNKLSGDVDKLYMYIIQDLTGYRGLISPFVKS